MGNKHDDACLKKVGDKEPIFVLRAQDKLAPHLVRIWARKARKHGAPWEKVKAALEIAALMEAYQKPKKYPD